MDFSNSECGLADCNTVSNMFCAGCTIVNYCCEDHQKADWRNHKKVCSPLTLQTSTELGRYYVASRDLKAGTLIVSELPLLVEPLLISTLNPQFQDLHNFSSNQSICLACCSPTVDDKKCPKCDWPICSIECSESKIHAENECSIFAKNSLKMNKMDQDVLTGVFFIRGMLIKKSQPKILAKTQGMQSENSDKTLLINKIFRKKFQKIKKEFDKDFFESGELAKLYGVHQLNSFTYRSEHEDKDVFSRNLYLKISMFSHACFPNCFYTISNSPDFKMEIRTAVDIAKGQILSIDYNNADFVRGSMEYNMKEMVTGNFNCFCARCIDPTELNTMISAVKCKKGDCQDGYLIPKEPKNFSPSSIWECIKCSDQSTETWERIKNITQIVENITKNFQVFEPKKIENLFNFLRNHLHPNHWVIQQFCQIVMKVFEEKMKSGNADEETVDCYIQAVIYLLKVLDLTMPGLNYCKSDVQCRLFNLLYVKLFVVERERINKDNELIMMNEMVKLYDTILKIKKFDTRYRTNDGQWKSSMLGLIANKVKLDSYLIENEN